MVLLFDCLAQRTQRQLHTLYHALHGGDAVRRCRLRLDCVSTLYFLSPCIAWWRRSTPLQAASRLRLYFILPITMHCMVETQYAAAGYGSTASLLYTSYHHTLHGGDAVRRCRLRLDCVSTLYFILPTSYFLLPTSFCATIIHSVFLIKG